MKHRWRVDQNYLRGITAGQWRRLLRENRYKVDSAYWHRAAYISVLSIFNSLAARKDERRYGREIDKITITDPPLFVLGHPRTGTTFLQNLLSRDHRFAYPNLYEILNPGSFLTHEDEASRHWAKMERGTRPMDNVAFTLETPQEDEFALALSCLRSPNIAMSFPRHGLHYLRYLTFEGVPAAEVEEWKRTLLWFAKKLTLRYRRPLVLKSPAHTARIRQLLEVFPEARFVNIHREPYTVYQSWRHTHDTAIWFLYLQKPEEKRIDEATLRMGRALFDAYLRQRDLIPAGRLVDVAYEDLEARPVQTMEEIYTKLGLPDFEVFRPTLQAYVDTLGPYKKNRFAELEPALRERVAEAWRPAFDAWGYPV